MQELRLLEVMHAEFDMSDKEYGYCRDLLFTNKNDLLLIVPRCLSD